MAVTRPTLLGVLLSCCCLLQSVGAVVETHQFFPFGVQTGDTKMPKSDDSATGPIRLQTPFRFFNVSQPTVYVSTNGVISFRQSVTYTRPGTTCSSLLGVQPLITPFWEDMNTASGGDIYYRETTDSSLLNKATQEIRRAFPEMGSVSVRSMFVATWDHVTFHGSINCYSVESQRPRNTFQATLATDGTYSFVFFYYKNITWTSISCAGVSGSPKAGFDVGDGRTVFQLPGSCSGAAANLPHTSNVNDPGKWIYRVDSSFGSPSGNVAAVTNSSSFIPITNRPTVGMETTVYGAIRGVTTSADGLTGSGSHTRSNLLFPFGVQSGDTKLPKGDDLTSSSFSLQVPFRYFNASQPTVFVSTNGVISFRHGINFNRPDLNCGSWWEGQPLLTPLWQDVNTAKGGDVYYRETTDSSLLNRATQEIRRAFPDMGGVSVRSMFIATWDEVASHGSTNCYSVESRSLRNTFQSTLATDGTYSFVLFYYKNIAWTYSNCLPGAIGSPKAGFDVGDGRTVFQLPGSCSGAVANLTYTSNVNEPGKWIYRVDSSFEAPRNNTGSMTLTSSGSFIPSTDTPWTAPSYTTSGSFIPSTDTPSRSWTTPSYGSTGPSITTGADGLTGGSGSTGPSVVRESRTDRPNDAGQYSVQVGGGEWWYTNGVGTRTGMVYRPQAHFVPNTVLELIHLLKLGLV